MNALVIAWALVALGSGVSPASATSQPASMPAPEAASGILFTGMSDASDGVALDEHRFLAVDDETNELRIYDVGGGAPLSTVDLSSFLQLSPRHPEGDFEGVTRVGDRLYITGSHGRNQDGKPRPNRCCLFAATLSVSPTNADVRGAGRPFRGLLEAMLTAPSLQELKPTLEPSIRLAHGQDETELAPKMKGLNIEGLCAAPDGKTLYLGLRNPPWGPEGGQRARAIVLPMLNPEETLLQGRGPQFGTPLLWDLEGLGIRSMEYSPFHKSYFIIAGPHDDGHRFRLFRWTGEPTAQPTLVSRLEDRPLRTHPEGVIPFEHSSRLLLICDDGTRPVHVDSPAECAEGESPSPDGTCPNKHLRDISKRSFRGFWLDPGQPEPASRPRQEPPRGVPFGANWPDGASSQNLHTVVDGIAFDAFVDH